MAQTNDRGMGSRILGVVADASAGVLVDRSECRRSTRSRSFANSPTRSRSRAREASVVCVVVSLCPVCLLIQVSEV